jgi:CRP-like cAMP-binding protein
MVPVLESVAWSAFLMGIFSACSLPLGALTIRFWRPDDRTTAVLMAFGGGALLAALTIDLVGSALQSGHLNALAVGAVLGGLLFAGLNQVVNDFGGFLRKASTTVYHLRRIEHQRVKRIATQIGRTDLFSDLSRREYKALAPSVRELRVERGSTIYQAGDPADAMFVVAAGTVELCNPAKDAAPVEPVHAHEVFGWLSCITGAPTSDTAVATTGVTLWVIPKSAVDALILNSPELTQRVHRLLRSPEIPRYLIERHGMAPDAARAWLDDASHTLLACGRVPPALPVRRNREGFRERLPEIRRFPLIQGLPPEEEELVLDRLVHKTCRRGQTLFHQNAPASRMFFIEHGRVSLVDPLTRHRDPVVMRDNDAFGGLSLLMGACHTTTAVATDDTTVWELRRRDLDELLRRAPALAQRVRDFVAGNAAVAYLTERQDLSADQAERWCRSALRALAAHQPLPAASTLNRTHRESPGAPLAIFLGMTLDGIPESVVIGASISHSAVSFSLIVGLFLANYPEALSSSAGMRQQGMSVRRIVVMWSALMLMTGAIAAAGSLFFVGADPHAFALVEGLAAGAMLTMIAETMLPEAYLKGGSVIGLSTLFGFLVAIYSKTLESPNPGHHRQHETAGTVVEAPALGRPEPVAPRALVP